MHPILLLHIALAAATTIKVSIQSANFPGSYLRIDGSGVLSSTGPGGGTVNCQNYVGPYETLLIENHEPTQTFSILSAQFPNVYLRMDGSTAVPGHNYLSGAGKVNCQYTAGPYEQFRWEIQGDGTLAIASVNFPGRYLRMSNPGSQGGSSGAGTVNVQTSIGPYEKFIVTWL